MQISIEKIFSYLGSLYMKTGKTKGLGDEKKQTPNGDHSLTIYLNRKTVVTCQFSEDVDTNADFSGGKMIRPSYL